MTPEKYRQWVAQLPSLTTGQLADLSVRSKLLGNASDKAASGRQDFGERVLNILCEVMRKNNAEIVSIAVLKKSSSYKNSTGKFDDLATYLDTISKSRIVQDQLLKIAINLLYNDLLCWQKVAISSHTMLNQIHRVPATLNRAFPGYAASGLLRKIVKAD